MGIQLSDYERQMIQHCAEQKIGNYSIYPYLFGALASTVDLFVLGQNQKSDLESFWASIKLVEQLSKDHNAKELREIAAGTREVAGAGDQSGQ